MRVVVLGAGTGIPAKDYSPAGVYVQIAHEHVLLDAGAGTLQRLRRAGVTYLDLDRVFLTHFHPDHCLDLVSLLFAARLPEPARTKPLTIYGPRGLKRLLRAFHRAYPTWLQPRTYRLNVKELGERTLWLPGYTVRTRRMNHYETGALGYRLEVDGKSIVYSGDTDACQAVVELGEEADLLLLECSVTDKRKVPGHLTPTECGRLAAIAACRRLVLTHFYPVFKGYDIRGRVRKAYRGPLTLARDFTSFRL
jgi:ribonuclease BN (tRNA processing enzyme)